jgi:hypothetical protein
MPVIKNTGDAVLVSFTNALSNLLGFIPSLIGAIIVLVIGWILSGILARLLDRVLQAVGFERVVDRSGIGDFIKRAGSGWNTSVVLTTLVKWFIRLIFIEAAANVLGMPQVTAFINSIELFLPKVFVALLIVIIGALLARLVAGLVRGSAVEMGMGSPDLLAAIACYAVLGFAFVAALDELEIAATVVNTLFIGLVASLALAVGLAFGLGGRDVAARITEQWYEGGRKMVGQAGRQNAQADRANGGRSETVANRPTTWRTNAS